MTQPPEPSAPLDIRAVGPQDRADWARLWQAYLAFYETTLPDENYAAQWARLMAPGRIHGRMAWLGDTPVGLVHYLFHDHGWKLHPICYLQDLYVDPGIRGRGVGRALIEVVYAAADAEGVPDVYWNTQDFNHAARRLYDRIGKQTPFIKYVRP